MKKQRLRIRMIQSILDHPYVSMAGVGFLAWFVGGTAIAGLQSIH